MSIEEIRTYALSLPYTVETMPFDDTTLVYKVGGKWFAVADLDQNDKVVVKCDPDIAVELRDLHEEITEAWHFNKRHWNDLNVEMLPDDIVRRELRHSYFTVIRKNVHPKALREEVLSIAFESGLQDDAVLPE